MNTRERIQVYVRTHPEASIRAIQKACKVSSPSVVHYHLKRIDSPRTVVCPMCDGIGRVHPSEIT